MKKMHIPIKKKKGVCIFMGKRNQENQNDNRVHEVGEDSTKYGEFISSYFAWVSLPNQKEKVEELENMTKKDEKKKNDSIRNLREWKTRCRFHRCWRDVT